MSETWRKSQQHESCWGMKKVCCWAESRWKRDKVWIYDLLKWNGYSQKAATSPKHGEGGKHQQQHPMGDSQVLIEVKKKVYIPRIYLLWQGQSSGRWGGEEAREREEARSKSRLSQISPVANLTKSLLTFSYLITNFSLTFLTTFHRLFVNFLLLQ